jgi:mono/diheme cytochrome c family protein
MKRFIITTFVFFVVSSIALAIAASQLTLSAIPEPSTLETNLVARAKHILIRRAAHEILPAAPADLQASIEQGDKLYGTECASCHGLTGRKPTDAGRWMYPRAADLGSPDVQQYSDGELFWIIKNGIRLSGMPAFGRVQPDGHVWSLVHYLRSLAGTGPHAGS